MSFLLLRKKDPRGLFFTLLPCVWYDALLIHHTHSILLRARKTRCQTTTPSPSKKPSVFFTRRRARCCRPYTLTTGKGRRRTTKRPPTRPPRATLSWAASAWRRSRSAVTSRDTGVPSSWEMIMRRRRCGWETNNNNNRRRWCCTPGARQSRRYRDEMAFFFVSHRSPIPRPVSRLDDDDDDLRFVQTTTTTRSSFRKREKKTTSLFFFFFFFWT